MEGDEVEVEEEEGSEKRKYLTWDERIKKKKKNGMRPERLKLSVIERWDLEL